MQFYDNWGNYIQADTAEYLWKKGRTDRLSLETAAYFQRERGGYFDDVVAKAEAAGCDCSKVVRETPAERDHRVAMDNQRREDTATEYADDLVACFFDVDATLELRYDNVELWKELRGVALNYFNQHGIPGDEVAEDAE